MDFGRKCINCSYFRQLLGKNIFGICHATNKPAYNVGAVHSFHSCDEFEEMPQDYRPQMARKVDFDLERDNYKKAMNNYLSK
jgi:hypothetical protein